MDEIYGDDDISWLTQSDSNQHSLQPSFNIADDFMELSYPVSLEENGNSEVEIYEGVYAQDISDDEAIDQL